MIRCQACGAENSDEATYCCNCARKLDVETQEAVVQRRATYSATTVQWSRVVVMAIILIVILVAVLFLTHVL